MLTHFLLKLGCLPMGELPVNDFSDRERGSGLFGLPSYADSVLAHITVILGSAGKPAQGTMKAGAYTIENWTSSQREFVENRFKREK